MKLLIAVPSLDFMHTEFVKSLTKLIVRLKNDGIDFDLDIASGTLVYVARDKLAKRAINEHFTHILWLDSDMVFTEDILSDLMFSGKPFVTGICHSRRKPFASCLFSSLNPVERFEEYPAGVFEVQGCGLAAALTEVQILRDVVITHHGTAFCPMPQYGEDLAFCVRVHECGYHIFADSSVRLGHIGHITIYPEDYERWKKEISNYEQVMRNG